MMIKLFLVCIGVFTALFYSHKTNTDVKKGVFSAHVTPTPMDAFETPSPTPEISTMQRTNTPIPPTSTPSANTSTSSDWQYPGSSGTNGSYTSSDDPKTITNWYKQKIKDLGMHTTSFVQTSTNDNVLNNLAGAGNGQNISVEIRRNAGESNTTITVKK